MHRKMMILATALTLAAGARAHAQEILAFGPGEQSIYKIQYLGMTAGTAQLTVGAETRQWGLPVWPIVTLASTDSLFRIYPVRDRFITYWDSTAGRTIGHDFYADEGRKKRRQRVKLDHASGSAQVMKQKEGEAPAESTHEIAAGSADVAAAVFALRSRPFKVGDVIEVPVFTGSKSFNLRASVEGVEQLDTSIGAREVFRIRVQTEFSGKLASKSDMVAFMTTDSARLPVRIEAEFVLGKVVAELKEYKAGRSVAALPSLAKDG